MAFSRSTEESFARSCIVGSAPLISIILPPLATISTDPDVMNSIEIGSPGRTPVRARLTISLSLVRAGYFGWLKDIEAEIAGHLDREIASLHIGHEPATAIDLDQWLGDHGGCSDIGAKGEPSLAGLGLGQEEESI